MTDPFPNDDGSNEHDQACNVSNRGIADDFLHESHRKGEKIARFLEDELEARDGEDSERSKGQAEDDDVNDGEG